MARRAAGGDTNRAASFVCAPAPGRTDPAQVPAPEYLN